MLQTTYRLYQNLIIFLSSKIMKAMKIYYDSLLKTLIWKTIIALLMTASRPSIIFSNWVIINRRDPEISIMAIKNPPLSGFLF